VRAPPRGAAIVPVDLSAQGLSGRALLRAAASALPGWAWAASAKVAALGAFLPALLAGGHKVLIFSQLMAVLTVLQVACASWGIRTVRLDGSMPVDERQALLDRFSADAGLNVFLLSTKAGGLGLNLTAADTVILRACRRRARLCKTESAPTRAHPPPSPFVRRRRLQPAR
jgi:SNF2 family DNA or RNA helicase